MYRQQTLRPFVYWAQDLEQIYLRVDIKEAKDIDFRILENGRLLDFWAIGLSSNSDNASCKYHFQLPLYDSVKETPKLIRAEAFCVQFNLAKAKHGFWSGGILANDAQKQMHRWLKVDFMNWRDDPNDEQSADEREEGNGRTRSNPHIERLMRELNLEKDQEQQFEQHITQHVHMMFSCYLFLYNVAMFIFSFLILSTLIFNYVSSPKAEFLYTFWPANFNWLLANTFFQFLDFVHSLLGLTSVDCMVSLIQGLSRLAMLLIVNACPSCCQWSPVFTLILTYLLSEQFRYPYYALKTLGVSLHFVTWLHFNICLLLYPLGLLLEGFIMLASVPFFYKSNVYSLQLPNSFNFSYNFGVLLALFCFTCFPFIGFTLIKRIFEQRRTEMGKPYRETMRRSRQKGGQTKKHRQ